MVKKITENEGSSLNDKERVVLLSLLGMRSFSLEHCVNLKIKGNNSSWLEIFRICDDFIVNNNIGKHVEKLDKPMISGQEAVFAIISRVEKLPKKTSGIIDNGKTKPKNYFLQMTSKDGDIDTTKFAHLMNLIIGDNSSVYIELKNFLMKLYSDNWVKVYDEPLYGDPSFDSLINDSTMIALDL